MTEREHDLCSPSQLRLRELCPGSANLYEAMEAVPRTRQVVGENTGAADRGTLLHSFCQQLLESGKDSLDSDAWLAAPEGDKQAVLWCVSRVRAATSGKIMLYERQVSLENCGISGGRNGSRVDVLAVDLDGQIHRVIDFKFGNYEVDHPKYNLQLLAYGLAVHNEFGGDVVVQVLQPEIEEEKRDRESVVSGEDNFTALQERISSVVAATKAESAPLVRGWHCLGLFCKAREVCPLHRGAVLEIPQHLPIQAHLLTLSPERRAELYERIKDAESWCKKARAVIEAMTLDGTINLAGYEVDDKAGDRIWSSTEKIITIFEELAEKNGLKLDTLVKPRQPITPSQAETVLGKAKAIRELLAPWIMHEPAKKALLKSKTPKEKK